MSSENQSSLSLPHGRQLALVSSTCESDQHVLTIANREGTVELEIELRDSGPVVRLRAASLAIETAGALSIDCQRFGVRASQGVHLETDGDLDVQTREGIRLATSGDLAAAAIGDIDCRATGHAHLEGKAVRVRARRGEALLEAHDDVRIEGERVLLNS